jgi:predicted O-methyltransferase YrrM
MPSLDIDFLKSLHADYTKYTCFIETGTLEGKTTMAMEPYFSELYTIEYSPKFHAIAKNNYPGNKIHFLLGDSSVVFETLLPKINDPCIFFLDGHHSGGETGKSAKDCPLIEEITHIRNLCIPEAIIIIDDVRLFGTYKDHDWTDITKESLLEILGDRVKEVYHLDSEAAVDDRLVLHISTVE